jgi:hypothetical protein
MQELFPLRLPETSSFHVKADGPVVGIECSRASPVSVARRACVGDEVLGLSVGLHDLERRLRHRRASLWISISSALNFGDIQQFAGPGRHVSGHFELYL